MSVGAQLRAARLEHQLSTADVVQAIKIQPWVLEALETDRLHTQMGRIYVKGFLTSYARFLKLDAEQLIKQITWPADTSEPMQATSLAAQVARANAKVAAAAAQAATPSPARVAATPSIEPVVVAPRASVRPMRTFEWPRVTIPWLLLKRLGSFAVVTAAIAAVVIMKPLHHPAKTAKTAKATPAKATPASKAKQASIAPMREAPKPLTLPTLTVLPTQALALSVTARQTTWIQIRADGKLVTQQRLQRGAQERWTAKKKLEVVVAKPSQIDLELNGQSISPFAIAHEGRLMITHYGVTRLPNERP